MTKIISRPFKTHDVKAILDNRKTQFRLEIKPQPIIDNDSGFVFTGHISVKRSPFDIHNWKEPFADQFCPYQPGDVLWVRESWGFHSGPGIFGGEYTAPSKRPGYERWKESVTHKAGKENYAWGMYGEPKWRPNIHMPKSACRLFLKVKSIRVERLQDISEEDAIAEGVQENVCQMPLECPSSLCENGCINKGQYYRYSNPMDFDSEPCYSAKESFRTLCQTIKGDYYWESNPLVFVAEFERCEKPDNFLNNQ